MIRSALLVCMIFIWASSAWSQMVVLEEHVDTSLTNPSFGKNSLHYLHSYIGYGFVAGQSEFEGMDVLYGNSGEFISGLRYKLKLSERIAIGAGVSFSVQYYALNQDSAKIYPTSVLHQKERYSFNNFGLDGFARINFDKKRGDVIGKYIDFGIIGMGALATKHYTKDLNTNAQNLTSKYIEVTESKLRYVNSYNSSFIVRLGLKSIAFVGKYRYTDIFLERFQLPELPRLIVGIEIGSIS